MKKFIFSPVLMFIVLSAAAHIVFAHHEIPFFFIEENSEL